MPQISLQVEAEMGGPVQPTVGSRPGPMLPSRPPVAGPGMAIEATAGGVLGGDDLLRAIIDCSPAVIYLKDVEGRYRLINRQWAEIFGVTPSSIIGKTDHEIFSPEIAAGFRINDVKILEGRQTVKLEELAPHRDGLHTYLSIKVPLLGPDGVPYALCGISTDISERKQMEKALRLSEQQFRGAFEASAIGMGLLDPEGGWLRVNPALGEILGRAEGELLGMSLTDLAHPDDRAATIDLMGQLLANEIGAFQAEKRFLHATGRTLWLRLSLSMVRNQAGQSVHFVAQVEDVTPRRRAEELAASLHSELEAAYDATITGWSRALDMRDHETEGHSQRVTDLTVRLARSMGLPEGDLLHIRRGALLHDIGKIGVPDSILLKPGPLTAEEWPIMRRHPDLAVAMLEPIAFLRPALAIPHCHHERWDGKGYPRGLAGEEIPLAARIFAAVDVWDALTHNRPYRTKLSGEEARSHLRSLAGTHLDPVVVDGLIALLDTEPAGAEARPPAPAAAGIGPPPPAPCRLPPSKPTDAVHCPARLDALRRSGLMDDTPEDPPFDRLVHLASKVLDAPVALVSLVDERRQFFKSGCGLTEPLASRRETPLSHSFCREVVRADAPLIVADARLDPRVRHNPAVHELGIVAYAGMPLRTAEGHVLGSFCVVDTRPRDWTDGELETLTALAEAVKTEIELRSNLAAQRQVEEKLRVSQRRMAEQLGIATELQREFEAQRRELAHLRAELGLDPPRSVGPAASARPKGDREAWTGPLLGACPPRAQAPFVNDPGGPVGASIAPSWHPDPASGETHV